jgi:hypothetical protein
LQQSQAADRRPAGKGLKFPQGRWVRRIGGCSMLQKLSDHVADCMARAAETERRAREMADSQLKTDLLDVARRWRHLAESYQFVDGLDRFLAEQRLRRTGHP